MLQMLDALLMMYMDLPARMDSGVRWTTLALRMQPSNIMMTLI